MKRFAVVALVVGALWGAASGVAWAGSPTYILGFRTTMTGKAVRLYKPKSFTPGSHYHFSSFKWEAWRRSDAYGTATISWGFAGGAPNSIGVAHNVFVEFYRPKVMCGVLTFTRWADADHNGQISDGGDLVQDGQSCFFVAQ